MQKDLANSALSSKLLNSVSIVVLFGTLILYFFTQASADDFWHGLDALDLGTFPAIKNFYYTWAGRYSSLFFWVTNPLAFKKIELYGLALLLNHIAYILSTYQLIKYTLKSYTGITHAIPLTLLCCNIYFAVLPSPVDSLYWHAGSIPYFLSLTFLNLCIYLNLKIIKDERDHLTFFIIILLSFILIGLNEVIMMIWGWMQLCILSWLRWQNKKLPKKLIIVLVCSLLFGCLSVFAPGNAIRGEYFPNSGRFFYSVGNSIVYAIFYYFRFLELPLLFFILWWTGANRFLFARIKKTCPRLTLFLGIILFGILQITFFTSIYAIGGKPPARMYNMIYHPYILLNLMWVPLVMQNYPKTFTWIEKKSSLFLVASIMSLFLIGNHRFLYQEYEEIIGYRKEMDHIFNMLKNDPQVIDQIEPNTFKPRLLMFRDISDPEWKEKIKDYFYKIKNGE